MYNILCVMTEVKIPLVNLKSDDNISKNWTIDFVSSLLVPMNFPNYSP